MARRVGGCRRAISATVGLAAVLAWMPAAGAAPGRWLLPVDGAVVRPFRAPVAAYGAGHRGIDLAAPPGTPVRAANDGIVVFAGTVAGSLHVVVAHDGGIRTSSSFLARVDVRVGQRVSRGSVIGAAGGTGDAHGAGVLHLGVRIGDEYVDPMLLFGPADLTKLVRLAPISASEVAVASPIGAERRALERALLDDWQDGSCAGPLGDVPLFGGGFEAACDALTAAVDAGLDGLRWVGGQAAAAAEVLAPIFVDILRELAEHGVSLAVAVARAGLPDEWVDTMVGAFELVARLGVGLLARVLACDQPAAKRHGAGSGSVAMVVAGLGSARRRRADGSLAPSVPFDREVLGYRKGEVAFFSYDRDRPTYRPRDTHGDLHAQARSLGQQLRAFAAQHPGRSVDLIGHSQGGVVIALFLAEVHRGNEAAYPPIPNVVTFASPLEGTPAANVASGVGRVPGAQHAFRMIDQVAPGLPLGAESLDQLRTDSSTIGRIGDASFAATRFLSIMGSADLVVPSPVGDVDGGEKSVVDVGNAWPIDDHSGIMRDDDALSAAQAHLAGGAPASCGWLAESLVPAVEEVVEGAIAGAHAAQESSLVEVVVP